MIKFVPYQSALCVVEKKSGLWVNYLHLFLCNVASVMCAECSFASSWWCMQAGKDVIFKAACWPWCTSALIIPFTAVHPHLLIEKLLAFCNTKCIKWPLLSSFKAQPWKLASSNILFLSLDCFPSYLHFPIPSHHFPCWNCAVITFRNSQQVLWWADSVNNRANPDHTNAKCSLWNGTSLNKSNWTVLQFVYIACYLHYTADSIH